MGLNILVDGDPTTGATPKTPDDRQLAAAEALHQALDPLVSPMSARTIVAIPGVPEPTVAPTASPSPKADPRPAAAEADRQGDQEAVTEPTRSARSRAASGRANDDVSPLDKRIIEHLQADGRRPFTQIAADLGVSEAAVRARTNRLIERGILQVVGVTDPLKLGFHQMAMIGIRCESSKLIEVAEQLAEMPEVDYVVITAGSYDLLIETVCEDNDALLAFLAERLRAIDGVRETETFVYLRLVKQTYQYGTR